MYYLCFKRSIKEKKSVFQTYAIISHLLSKTKKVILTSLKNHYLLYL